MKVARLPAAGTVRRAVHDELARLGALDTVQGCTALALAKDVDRPGSTTDRTSAARELRMQMTELRARAERAEADGQDELAAMRERSQNRAG